MLGMLSIGVAIDDLDKMIVQLLATVQSIGLAISSAPAEPEQRSVPLFA
jgi:hypothetical protein